jgi:hypothetical protein
MEMEGVWVDFPASPDPDPWATLLRKANRLPSDVSGMRRAADGALPGTALMTKLLDQRAAALNARQDFKHDISLGDHWDARRVGGAVMTSLAVVLRGLIVTGAALATVAYLLLTNSHI